MTRAPCVGLCLCASLFLHACAAGWIHTPDASLDRIFREHQFEFEALLGEVQADSKLTTLQPSGVIYAGHLLNVGEANFSDLERLGLPRERWVRYQKQLQDLGLEGGILKRDGSVEFRVDPGSFLNGDSYKGYVYTPTPPDHVRSSLDAVSVAKDSLQRPRSREASGSFTETRTSWKNLDGTTCVPVVLAAAFKKCCLRKGTFDGERRNHFF